MLGLHLAKGTGGNSVNQCFVCLRLESYHGAKTARIISERTAKRALHNDARIHRLWHADRELRGEPA